MAGISSSPGPAAAPLPSRPPSSKPPRPARSRATEELPDSPTLEQLQAHIRRRPVGQAIADICRDLGISPSLCEGTLWNAIYEAITWYRGSFHRYYRDIRKRQVTYADEWDRDRTHAFDWPEQTRNGIRGALGFFIGEPGASPVPPSLRPVPGGTHRPALTFPPPRSRAPNGTGPRPAPPAVLAPAPGWHYLPTNDQAPDQPGPPATADPAPAPKGVTVIEAALTTMPPGPGVYRMLDAKGDALYVGKARALKKRVTAYTQPVRLDERLRRMVNETSSMEVITTHTEAEALLLEANLIKRLKPRFNIVLRDDKSYPWLMLTEDHPYPQIAKHRGAQVRKGSYWGPFASAWAVNQTVTAMQRIFLLRSCADTVFANRTRPCLLHQIKRCSAPCVGRISEADYGKLVDQAKAFLSGKSATVQQELAADMEQAAEHLEFERAAAVRDRIRALTFVQGSDVVNPASLTDADVIAAWQTAGQTCVQVFFVRGGRNNGNRAFFPTHAKNEEAGEVLAAFVAQFYDDKPPPPVPAAQPPRCPSRTLIAEALSLKAGRKVELRCPSAARSARWWSTPKPTRARRWNASWRNPPARRSCWTAWRTLFGLPAPPQRIEVYDNSHIMGTNPYGVMIVAGAGGLHQVRLPQVRHPRPGHPRRRLRHDARGAAAPVQPSAEGAGGRRAGDATGRISC